MLRHWSQFVPNMSTDVRGHEDLHHHHHNRFCCFVLTMHQYIVLTMHQYAVKKFITAVVFPEHVVNFHFIVCVLFILHGWYAC